MWIRLADRLTGAERFRGRRIVVNGRQQYSCLHDVRRNSRRGARACMWHGLCTLHLARGIPGFSLHHVRGTCLVGRSTGASLRGVYLRRDIVFDVNKNSEQQNRRAIASLGACVFCTPERERMRRIVDGEDKDRSCARWFVLRSDAHQRPTEAGDGCRGRTSS
jgi:hypothetical protein